VYNNNGYIRRRPEVEHRGGVVPAKKI